MNIKRLEIIHDDTDYGKSLSRAQRKLLPKAGYELVAYIEYNAKAPDLTSPVLNLKSAAPELVIQSSYFPDSLQISKIANQLGMGVPFVDAEGKAVHQYPKAAGPLCEGDFVLVQWNGDLPHPLSLELARQYEKRYKGKADHGMGAIFQAMLVVRRAIETAGSLDPEAVNDKLHKIEILPGPDLILPYEKIKFDETGMNTFGRPAHGHPIPGRKFRHDLA